MAIGDWGLSVVGLVSRLVPCENGCKLSHPTETATTTGTTTTTAKTLTCSKKSSTNFPEIQFPFGERENNFQPTGGEHAKAAHEEAVKSLSLSLSLTLML